MKSSGATNARQGWRKFPFSTFVLLLTGLALLVSTQEDVPPYFKTEPAATQVQLEGNRLVVTCVAEGSWPLEYKWMFNGSDVTTFSPDYRYIIPSLRRSDSGFYQCVVRNRMGALLQRRAEVHVSYMGDFTQQEQRKTVSLGKPVMLSAPSIRSWPRPHFTWYRDGHKIIPNSRVSVTLDHTLVLLAVTASDAGTYHVEAVNERTGENKSSPGFYLSVTADPESPSDDPVIVIPPRNTTVVTGTGQAILECIASAKCVENVSVSWQRDGVLLSGTEHFGRRLVIPTPTLSDMGTYVCVAALHDGEAVVSRVFLTVTVPPYFSMTAEKRIVAERERNVEIPCQAKGSPTPRLDWYKDAVPLSKLSNPRYRLLAGVGLQVRKVQPSDSGIFQCVAHNSAGEDQQHTSLIITSVPPAFVKPPINITVSEGAVAVFTCQVSGAPKPSITWTKGSQVLASGSVKLPRFRLLELGGLRVDPVSPQDTGEYSCSAHSEEGVIIATAWLSVWSRTSISSGPQDQRVIKGTMAVLDCQATADPRVSIRYEWQKDGVRLRQSPGGRVLLRDGSLHISQTWSGDIGDYSCTVLSQAGNDSKSARLEVIELPHSPRNLQARLNASHSRTVELSWARPFDGNSPLLYYTLELSENNSPWKVYLAKMSSNMSSVRVGRLTPARTYRFRVCAINQVGKGQYSAETNRLMLPEEPPSSPPKNIVASGRTNQSIMVQWQPPPEPELNGVLRGYLLRYRLAGLPGDFQQKNISSPEVNYCLIRELIIWTQYEIQVAAYTWAGLGVFSPPVSEYTLQGVPTAPPQDVEAEALNSTTVRFSWNPPPQQFINGINQGYKLLAWPEQSPEDVTMVTITPDFHGSRHVGYISGLKKFCWYQTAVLCFTTPGEGPSSTPQLVHTHADKPGPVQRLSFTEILDTSLRVSWQEPLDRNGIITGYLLSWESEGQNSSHVSHSLPNDTLEYKLSDLTSLTTYTLQVSAVTEVGPGPVTTSTVSTGVPPELPGPPSNIIISNISPRSATLGFTAGQDGKTVISKWIVEGQVGSEDKGWRILYEKDNEPDIRVLEIPNLIPFTIYRFRMRQLNLLGSSPASSPSHLIQTLQAPPDTAPQGVSVRATSETSLTLRWEPLSESEYNGSPESVGYTILLWRVDPVGETQTHTVSDRLQREATLEGLDEFTEYQLHIQAYNTIGPGPWSLYVRGRTRDSVPSAPPHNITLEAVSSTRMSVTWGCVPEGQQNGHILGYKVLYWEQDTPAEQQVLQVKGNASGSVILRDLHKFTLYHVRVLAFTRLGDGKASAVLQERTTDDVPGPPVRLIFPDVRLTAVRLVWDPPAQPNGVILGYQIAYRLDTSNPNHFTTVEVGSSTRQFTVTGLTPESLYYFRVLARTQQGWGTPEEAVVITTERRERPQPPRKLSVSQRDVQSRSLQLCWHTGGPDSAPVRYYTLQTCQMPAGDWNTHTSSISHNNTCWQVDRLKPFTSYKLRMMAINDMGGSEYSRETDTVTTLQDVPEEPPVIRQVKPSTTTSVLVQWQAPCEDSLNGVLVGFRLYYRQLPLESSGGANHSTPLELAAKSTFKTISRAALTEFELTQLNKYKRYEIVMTAYNIVGESPPSTPVEVFVGEAAPSLPPQNIQLSSLSNTQLELQWEPPPTETQNGNILGYKIHYWEQERQNETERVKVIFVPDTSIRLKNLTTYTFYLVKLLAFNTAGDGPLSQASKGRTLQAAPSTPSYISFSEVTCSSMNVSWGAPVSPNGVVQGYRVQYQSSQPVTGVSKLVSVDISGSWKRWLKVQDLSRGVSYCFQIRARTVSYGPALEANITARPVPGSPGSPNHMSITKSSTSLTIHWLPGHPGAAPITSYVIEARPSDESLWDTFVKHLSPGSTSHTLSVERLRQSVSYEFRVIAVNELGYGEPSLPSAATSALSQGPFHGEWWIVVVMVTGGLALFLILVFGLLLYGKNKKYKICSPGKHVSTAEESVTLDNGGFTALELNSRHLNMKNAFLKKNGTRSPPRPSPGHLHYSDEDLCNNYNGNIVAESTALTEKPSQHSESEASDSDSEDEPPKHSFVNHYMSDPTYYNSWKRQPKGLKAYEECDGVEDDAYYHTVVTQHNVVGAYTASGQPATGSRTPLTGFSSFV